MLNSNHLVKTLFCAAFFLLQGQFFFASVPKWSFFRNLNELNSVFDEYNPVFSVRDSQLIFTREQQNFPVLYRSFFNYSALHALGAARWNPLPEYSGSISYPFFRDSTLYFTDTRLFESYPHPILLMAGYPPDIRRPVRPIEENIAPLFSSQICISADGQSMLFVSDREGGLGGTDIWMMSKQPDGSWGTPFNPGDPLNSPGNELTPFFAGNDTIYFASDGIGGRGALDLFISVREHGIWQAPLPLEDINTEYNESDFIIAGDSIAFFASDRPGGRGGSDLYIAKLVRTEQRSSETILPEFLLSPSVSQIIFSQERQEAALPFCMAIFPENIAQEAARIASRMESLPQSTLWLSNHILQSVFIQHMPAALHGRIFVDSIAKDSLLLVGSNEPLLFLPGANTLLFCEPDTLRLTINARPSASLKNWSIYCADSIMAQGTQLPVQKSIHLLPLIHSMQADSFQIQCQGNDYYGRSIYSTLQIPIHRQQRSSMLKSSLSGIIMLLPGTVHSIQMLRHLECKKPFILYGLEKELTGNQAVFAQLMQKAGLSYQYKAIRTDSDLYTALQKGKEQYSAIALHNFVYVMIQP
jgi:hypothetical protein